MAFDVNPESYESWPADPTDRRVCAEELFGRHVVAQYDSILRSAAGMVLGTWRYQAPTEEQRRVGAWLDSCSEEDRECAFALVRDMVNMFIHGLLADLDGIAGCFLMEHTWEGFRVAVEIHRRLEGGERVFGEEPLETLPVNPRARGLELHYSWWDWQKQYSRWYRAPLHELGEAVRHAPRGDACAAERDGDNET